MIMCAWTHILSAMTTQNERTIAYKCSDTMTNPIQNSISTSAPKQSVPADDCTESVSSHENKATESNKSATEDKQLMKSLLTQIRNMPEANLASPSDDFSSNWHHSAAYPPLGHWDNTTWVTTKHCQVSRITIFQNHHSHHWTTFIRHHCTSSCCMQNLSVEAVRSVQREKQREQINRDDNKPGT